MTIKNGVLKTISGVIGLTVLSKIFGFLRELLLSYYFGASGLSDAYIISQTIPGTIFQFVGTGLITCFVPIYIKELYDSGQEEADDFSNSILSLILIFSTVVMLIVMAFPGVIVGLFASGFEGETLHWAVLFTRIGICNLYFSAFLYLYNSYLQAHKIFYPGVISGLINSIVIILGIIVGAKKHVIWLCVISTSCPIIQLVYISPFIKREKFKVKPNFQFKTSVFVNFLKLLIPVIIGVSVNEVNILVDRTLASRIAVGGISSLVYANSLINFIQQGISQPVASVFFPHLSEKVVLQRDADVRAVTQRSCMLLIELLAPITVLIILFSKEITIMLFGRGAFNGSAISLTSEAVKYYSIGIVFVGAREFISRYFYAYNNTKIPTINSAIGMIVNIFLNLVLSKIMGLSGLALATSISAAITVLMLILKSGEVNKENKKLVFNIKELLRNVASLTPIILVYLIFIEFTRFEGFTLMVVVAIIGMLLWLICNFIFNTLVKDFVERFVSEKKRSNLGN
ncbi:putative peptidoglycan lipid II flippase [Butyrivibrio proteoclasticus]|uniref:Lipid II flippase n=1 Tax=Butyrivibrio proteoclasticus TaxID=43305 RepID=A0A1I5XNS3_9FIRM|nr:murein biosynthesis integral membrane protein MurJ [Butyrivibrio proteoclasticus]SFQ33476.1 putative peptidoglycan lipid II flippase [Butyrivibrio proteoclasticus]